MMFGMQYLLDVTVARGAEKSRSSFQLRVVDDRRYQLRVYDDQNLPFGGKGAVHVVVALYNRGRQLESWVSSLEKLSPQDKEQMRICLADFASTDINVRGGRSEVEGLS